MTEGVHPAFEHMRWVNRGLMEKVLDRAVSDPEWKRWFLEDPGAATREAGFPEEERLICVLMVNRLGVRG